jgi:hypothetical protein
MNWHIFKNPNWSGNKGELIPSDTTKGTMSYSFCIATTDQKGMFYNSSILLSTPHS